MAQIRNLHWWTVEYGLIAELENPKIYGAGLLSSIGESKTCLNEDIKKIPYSIEAANISFDITQQQPQLFVTPNFAHLSYVLEKFANTMALRKGGLEGVEKLIESKNIGTIELSTGIQISGKFSKVFAHQNKPIYIQTIGETALASRDKELIGHGINSHSEGFGSPIGKLEGINLAIEDMSPKDLEIYGIYEGRTTELIFEGGIKVVGQIITGKRDLQGKILLISFKNCTVTYNDTILFKPEWGNYDMAVGKKIISAFSGPASIESFNDLFKVPNERTHKISYSKEDKKLYSYYSEIRKIRESDVLDLKTIETIFNEVSIKYPNEWLLILEIHELVNTFKNNFHNNVLNKLEALKTNITYKKLIEDGINLLS